MEGIDRRNPLKAARAVFRAAGATLAARRLLKRLGADAVMGGGGYVAAPVGLAARSLGLPVVATEADSHLGITNRLLARFADTVFLAFPIEGREGERYRVVGRPLPEGTGRADRDAARRHFGIEPGQTCLLVFGGSLGARRINQATIEAFGSGGAGATCCTPPGAATTTSWPPAWTSWARRRTTTCTPTSTPSPTRWPPPTWWWPAPAGSVLEVAAAGLPSVLVPYPHATADHQTLNARHMERAGAAVVVPDDELDGPRLAREVGRCWARPTGWRPWAARPPRWRGRTRRGWWPTGCWSSRARSRRSAPWRPAPGSGPARAGARPPPDAQADELADLGAAGHADLDHRAGAVEQLALLQAGPAAGGDAAAERLGAAARRGS